MNALRPSTIQQRLLHRPFRCETKFGIVTCILLSLLATGCFPPPEHRIVPIEILRKGGLNSIRQGLMDEYLTVGSTTREDVVSRLGKPTSTLGTDRYLHYSWYCADGSWWEGGADMGSYGPIIEFDEQDIVKRFRVLYECERELYLSRPLEIPVVLEQETTEHQEATLVLSKNSVELRGPSHSFEISPEEIVRLRPCGEDDGSPPDGYCVELGFSEETEVGDSIRIRLDAFDAYPFARYILRNCPNYVPEFRAPGSQVEETPS